MRVAPAETINEEQRRTLERWVRGRSRRARQVERARIVLAVEEARYTRLVTQAQAAMGIIAKPNCASTAVALEAAASEFAELPPAVTLPVDRLLAIGVQATSSDR